MAQSCASAPRSRSMPLTAKRSTCCSSCWCRSRRPNTHLQILSELAQMFSDKAFRESLNHAPTLLRSTSFFPNGNRMQQANVARLYDDNAESLRLAWVSGSRTAALNIPAFRRNARRSRRLPQRNPSRADPGSRAGGNRVGATPAAGESAAPVRRNRRSAPSGGDRGRWVPRS